MFRLFRSKQSEIFNCLVKQAAKVCEAAEIFSGLAHHKRKIDAATSKLQEIEDEADKLVHKITDDIEKIFILPLDKEDIKELAESLDDIIDNLEQVVNRIKIYKVDDRNSDLVEFADLISSSAKQTDLAVRTIQKHKFSSRAYASSYKKLHSLENRADKVHRRVLEKLLGRSKDGKHALFVIKKKEIYDTLEQTLDRFEDMAILFERLKLKYR